MTRTNAGLHQTQIAPTLRSPAGQQSTRMGDLYILNTRCKLTNTIKDSFEEKGFVVKVSEESGVTDENLRQAFGYTAICLFFNKTIKANQVNILKENGNKLILHCSAGFDNSPTEELRAAGIRAARVPSYSPASIAEYAVTQIMALAKNTHMSYVMTKRADFQITDMQCVLMENKVCGVIGTGLIGKKFAAKISGLVEKVLCFDVYPDKNWIGTICNAEYVDMDSLLGRSDFISIHVPLLPQTHHLINSEAFSKMKENVIIVNTSRGEIIHIPSLIQALEDKKLWGVALDVFEGEKNYIFHDKSKVGFRDDPNLAKLAQFDHVILSSHIAFYTDQAVEQISVKTLQNFCQFISDEKVDEKSFVC